MKQYLLSLLIIFSLTACHSKRAKIQANSDRPSEQINSDCQIFRHEVDETKICRQPQRIAVLNPKMLDLLLTLDVQPAGYAEVFDYQKEFQRPEKQIPYLGDRISQPIANLGISSDPSLEAIATLKPDLILGDSSQNKAEYAQLSQIAPTLLFEYFGHDEWQQPLQTIAKVLGRTRQAEIAIANYQQQLDNARKTLATVAKTNPKVLMLASEQLSVKTELVTSKDFCGGLIEDLGFQLVKLNNSEPQSIIKDISIELLPQLDADIVIVQGHNLAEFNRLETVNGFEEAQLQTIQAAWQSNAIAKSLKATQNERVYFLPTYVCRGLPSPTGAKVILKKLQEQLSRA